MRESSLPDPWRPQSAARQPQLIVSRPRLHSRGRDEVIFFFSTSVSKIPGFSRVVCGRPTTAIMECDMDFRNLELMFGAMNGFGRGMLAHAAELRMARERALARVPGAGFGPSLPSARPAADRPVPPCNAWQLTAQSWAGQRHSMSCL